VIQLRPRDPATIPCHGQAGRIDLQRFANDADRENFACCEAEPMNWCASGRRAQLDIEETTPLAAKLQFEFITDSFSSVSSPPSTGVLHKPGAILT
jgi:hypothetical protein